jgi:magnesium transporter
MITAFYLAPSAKAAERLTQTEAILEAFRGGKGMLWVDMEAPTEDETNLLESQFGFHPVSVQTCREVTSQPLVHSYDTYLFMVLHAITSWCPRLPETPHPKGDAELETSELDFFWGKHFVLTYHEEAVGSISDVRQICGHNGRSLMGSGTDFFMHAIVDRVIDNFAGPLAQIDDHLEAIEAQTFRRPTNALLQDLLRLKETVWRLMRIATAQRDVVGRISRGDLAAITKQALVYWREAYDHLVRMVQTMESQRELINTTRDTYISVVSNRMNEIMKVLTIIATVFMPLTFIVGLYGMNFKHMPELDWHWGYPAVLVVMAAVAIGMVVFFRRKRWI